MIAGTMTTGAVTSVVILLENETVNCSGQSCGSSALTTHAALRTPSKMKKRNIAVEEQFLLLLGLVRSKGWLVIEGHFGIADFASRQSGQL